MALIGCPTEPAVTNSKAALLTNRTNHVDAYYECLSGFAMGGNQTITCDKSLGIWPSPPSCSVIESNVYVSTTGVESDNWWTYILAFFLIGMMLLTLCFLIWCCCWAPRSQNSCCCRCYRRGSTNTTPVTQGIYRDSIFWIDDSKTPREAPVYRTPRHAKEPGRESKMWMPHSHTVRDNNTSTK